jgi:hypothetical protein
LSGLRDKYINKNAILTHQITLEYNLGYLFLLKQELYILLDKPFRQLPNTDDNGDGYNLNGFIIWQEDEAAELPSFRNFNDSVDYQIILYQLLIDKLTEICYTMENAHEVEQLILELVS